MKKGLYKSIVVREKKDEPGAYLVTIEKIDGKKNTYKWFRGGRTFPARSNRFYGIYGKICRLIEEAYKTKKTVEWSASTPRDAVIHEIKSRAAGACD